MMRQSSRNQRNKKLKMKHALQIIVLLAISIWLLYQLKHTFDKKHSVDSTVNNPDQNPISTNEQRVPEKTTKLGRKDLPQYIENGNSNSERENQVDEEDEEKDTELEQLLEDVEARENGQDDGEENGEDDETVDGEYNGEEDEEGNTDSDANSSPNEIEVNSNLPSINASSSVQSESASNQTVNVNLSTNQENNITTNVEEKEVGKSAVQDGLHAIQGSSVQATNGTTTDAISYLSTKVEGKRAEIKEGQVNFIKIR